MEKENIKLNKVSEKDRDTGLILPEECQYLKN